MEKLSKKEFLVLWSIEEGMDNLDSVYVSTGIEINELKKIFDKLENLKFVKVTRKFDNHYKKDYWQAETKDKAKLVYEKYKKWIPQ